MPQMKSALPNLMLSIEKCYGILNQNTQKYTQEEVKEIRNTLYQLAEIIYISKMSKDENPQRKKSCSL